MRKPNKLFMLVLLIVAAAVFIYLSYLSSKEFQVKTAEAALRDITQSISYAGAIDSPKRVKVGSKIAGRVSEVLFNELDDVQ